MNYGLNGDSRIAAFFDLDGTLIAEPSLEVRFFSALRQHGDIPLLNYARWAGESLRLLRGGLTKIQHANKRYLCRVERDLIYRHVAQIPIFDEAISRLAWHARQGHTLVLVSGTLEPLAHMAAIALECELEARGVETRLQTCATRLEENFGRWTGKIVGEAVYGPAKRDAVLQFAKEYSIDLRGAHAYGNSIDDSFMLSAVGHAHVVNPNKRLATLAHLYDWPVWHWQHEKSLPSAMVAAAESKIQQLESGV
jgi:HAD superfamily hydrolase (TIGR01490 family)